jgi:hypothetical protein
VGSNNHTASKPYTYAEVSKYYNLKAVNEQLKRRLQAGGQENYGMRILSKSRARDIGLH